MFLKNDRQKNFQIKTPLPDTFLLTKYKLLKNNQSKTKYLKRFANNQKLKYDPSKKKKTTNKKLKFKK